jgi:hypothetical protein
MGILKMNSYSKNISLRKLFGIFLLGAAVFSIASCSKTVKVYVPPRYDLTQLGRLGIITFSDNAQPSVAGYATEQFQNEIHSAQVGIPIVELGSVYKVLKSVGSNQLDSRAIQKIGKQYKVSAIFTGSVVYSDIKTDVNLSDYRELRANVNTTLNATLSSKLIETEGGATVWSNSVSWKRKLGKLSVGEYTGVSVGNRGYEEAYKKLVPDMVWDVTRDFRGTYVTKRVDK